MRKLVIRKQADGINHEAVIIDETMSYGKEYPLHRGSGYTKSDALNDLISGIKTEIFMLEQDLNFALCGHIENA